MNRRSRYKVVGYRDIKSFDAGCARMQARGFNLNSWNPVPFGTKRFVAVFAKMVRWNHKTGRPK